MGDLNSDNFIFGKYVGIKNIKPGMLLAADVVGNDGSVYITRGTTITESHIRKLESQKIKFIRTVSDNPNEIRRTDGLRPSDEDINVNVKELPEFKQFEKVHKQKDAELKKYVLAISDGATINLEELFNLTDDIISGLKCKSDILTFLGHIKTSDEHTFTHSNNVALLCNLFGHWLNFDDKEILLLTVAGILHDVGKTTTPPEILNKKGSLTQNEYQLMKEHALRGYRILEKQDIPQSIKYAALMHHEKMNGTGYPFGLKDKKIDSLAKIVSICDIYDAMTANRVYRPKLCPFEVIGTFEKNGYGELDTKFLLIFLRNIAYTYLDNSVKLNNGQVATVAFVNEKNLSKPMVKLENGSLIDLSAQNELYIFSLH